MSDEALRGNGTYSPFESTPDRYESEAMARSALENIVGPLRTPGGPYYTADGSKVARYVCPYYRRERSCDFSARIIQSPVDKRFVVEAVRKQHMPHNRPPPLGSKTTLLADRVGSTVECTKLPEAAQLYTPIQDLQPGINRDWAIMVRVAKRIPSRQFRAKPGKFFWAEFVDRCGMRIRAYFWNKACEHFSPMVKEASCYILQGNGVSIRKAHPQYNPQGVYELSINSSNAIMEKISLQDPFPATSSREGKDSGATRNQVINLESEDDKPFPQLGPLPRRRREHRVQRGPYDTFDTALEAGTVLSGVCPETLCKKDRKIRAGNEKVDVYRCPYGDRVGWQRCPWTLHIIHGNNEYFLEAPAEHAAHERIATFRAKAPRLTPAARNIIDADARDKLPARKTVYKLDRQKLLPPSDAVRRQVYNRRYTVRSKVLEDKGLGKSFIELQNYVESLPCPENGIPLTDDSQAFCLASSLDPNGEYYAYFSSVSLLKNHATSNVLVGDYTHGLSWKKCLWAQGVPDEVEHSMCLLVMIDVQVPNYIARSNNACEATNRALKEGDIEKGTSIAALTVQLMELCFNYSRRAEANLKTETEEGKIDMKFVREGGKWTRTLSASNIWTNDKKSRYYIPSYRLVKACRSGSGELERIMQGFEMKYESENASAWASWEEFQLLMTNIIVVERKTPCYECNCPRGRTSVCKHLIGVYLLENALTGYHWKDFTIPGGTPAGRPRKMECRRYDKSTAREVDEEHNSRNLGLVAFLQMPTTAVLPEAARIVNARPRSILTQPTGAQRREDPLREIMVQEEDPLREMMVQEEDPLREMMVQEEDPLREMMVQEEDPLREMMVQEEDPLREMMVQEEAPITELMVQEEDQPKSDGGGNAEAEGFEEVGYILGDTNDEKSKSL
ncbi:hypothetical protein FOL47_000170, partial [Perkinsus chesapeaki]